MQTEKKPLPNVRHQNDVEELKTWIAKHGSHAVTAVLAVLIVLAALHVFHSRAAQRTVEANRRLATAQSASDFEGILADFGKSDVAPLAQLSLAKLNFDTANFELALSQYDQFLVQWPTHDMRKTAELGRIFCIEARGQKEALSEASAAFAAFATANPDHHLAPQAIFGQARCLEQQGELSEARAIYEDFITAQPENLWTIQAEELLSTVQRKIDRLPPQS
jgi:predicted negative regulator of RcsB-dependent stress response